MSFIVRILFITTSILFYCAPPLLAQQCNVIFVGTVTGRDEFEKEPYPLQNANVKIECLGDTTYSAMVTTNNTGGISKPPCIPKKPKDLRLRLQISYVGMHPLDTIVSPFNVLNFGPSCNVVYKFDNMVLTARPMTLEEATIVGELKKMYEKGDTIIFNTDAVEMPSGSVLLELVRRLPGLQYKDGVLTYRDRNIEEIRLNGDTFFRDDLTIALKNMPNEKLRSLKIYEALNDTLDMASDKHLVMDMETKEEVRHTLFANAEAGKASTAKDWTAGGNVNSYIRGGAQTSLMANFSRLPNYHIAEDRLTIGTLNGSYDQDFKNIHVNPSVRHEHTERSDREDRFSRIFLPDYTQFTDATSLQGSKQQSTDGKVILSGTKGKQLSWNNAFSVSRELNENTSSSSSKMSSLAGKVVSDIDPTTLPLLNSSSQENKEYNLTTSFRWNGGLSYNISPQDQLSLSLNINTGRTKSHTDDRTDITYHQLNTRQIFDRRMESPQQRLAGGGGLGYTHRFGGKHFWNVNYNIQSDNQERDYTYYDKNEAIPALIDSLSYGERHHQLSNSLTGSVRWTWEKLKIETKMHVSHLQNHIKVSPLSTKVTPADTTYSYIQYMPEFYIEYGKMGRHVSLKYTGNNQAPFTSQLITIQNLQDPLNTTVGNSNLKQEFIHNLSLHADLTSQLSMQGNVAIYDNKITMFSIYDPMTGRMQLQYDNIDGNWNTSWKLACNSFIKHVTVGGSISETYAHSTGYISEAVSGTPVRNNIDAHRITADANCRYDNKYILSWVILAYSKDIRISRNQDNKINTDQFYLSLNGSYYHPSGFTYKTDIQYDWYKGYRLSSGSRNECKWNMQIEYSFLRKRKATVSLGWYDILNSGSHLNEIMTDTEWTERWRKGKTSYALLKFAYRFNRIK